MKVRLGLLVLTLATPVAAQLDTARTAAARALLAGMTVEARDTAERYLAASDTTARQRLAGWLATKPDAAEFVLAVVEAEPSASIRQTLLLFTYQPYLSEAAYWLTNAHASEVLASVIATDPDTAIINLASSFLHGRAAARVQEALKRRLASDAADPAVRRVLTRLQEEWTLSASAVMLPGFMREPPPAFRVPEVLDPHHVRVVAFGDFGFDEEVEEALERSGYKYEYWESQVSAALRAYQSRHPFQFGITLGDNFYPSGMRSPTDPDWRHLWDEKYGALGIPFYPSFGNHDFYNGDSPPAEIAHSTRSRTWRFPAEFYTYRAGPAQFFAIDGNNLSVRQLDWLKQELERSTARWKIVYGHFPPYFTTGRDPRDSSGRTLPTEDTTLVETLVPVLRGRADVYISGHSHTFQFFKPIDGVQYIIAGTGGAPLYTVNPQDSRLRYATATAGFTGLDITDSTTTVSFVTTKGVPQFTAVLRKPY